MLVGTPSLTQQTWMDPVTSNRYYQSALTVAVIGIKRVLNAIPDPIPIYVQARMQGYAPHWEDIAYFDVSDPTFTFNPPSPAVKVSDTIPVSIRRSIYRQMALEVTVYSGNDAVLGLGPVARSDVYQFVDPYHL